MLAFILNNNSREKEIKIPVDNRAKTLLLDVINELEKKKAKRKDFELTECPNLSYATNMKSFDLSCDKKKLVNIDKLDPP